jgi:hypothetical protein
MLHIVMHIYFAKELTAEMLLTLGCILEK